MAKKQDKQKNKKLAAMIGALAGIGIGAASIFAAVRIYDGFFPRYERPDYALTAGLYEYAKVAAELPREERDFLSGNCKLKGYRYPAENSKGLVVVCHGMHAGADDYLPFIRYFVRHGFSVFSFDYTGTYSSEGQSTVGMCQSLADLDRALCYVKTAFPDVPLLLFGHSWGGYAVTSVLSLHKDVKACAAVAPFNSGFTLISEKAQQYAGGFAADFPKPFLDSYQRVLFGDYVRFDAVQGINAVSVPVLVAHGKEDEVISYDGQSVTAHRGEITNGNVVYYTGEGMQGGHDGILLSENAVAYRREVKERLKQLKKEKATYDEQKAFIAGVDDERYCEVNGELFAQIVAMYEKAVAPSP